MVTGDIVFDHVYFGVPKDKAREDWMKTLDQIAALKPAILIPGHEGPGAKHDLSAIALMKKYIADWDANVARSKNAAEMRANVLRQYPELGMEFTFNDRIATYFPAAKMNQQTRGRNIYRRYGAGDCLCLLFRAEAQSAASPALPLKNLW